MAATLGEIPLELRFDSAMESAARYRAAAASQHGCFFAHRRGVLLKKAERMEVIAEVFLAYAEVIGKMAQAVNVRLLETDASEWCPHPAEFKTSPKVIISDESDTVAAVQKAAALEEAAAYKKRRRQKDSFKKKMRELGYEPVMDFGRRPTPAEVERFQAPENWRRIIADVVSTTEESS